MAETPETPWTSHPDLGLRVLRRTSSEVATTTLRWTHDGVLVEVSGELDAGCTAQLAEVRHALAAWAHRAVVDAAGVTFVDVGGLRAVLELAPPGGSLLVLRPSRPLLRLLDLLQAATAWPAEMSVGPREEALVLRRPAPEPAEQRAAHVAANAVLPPPRSG
ncbi:MAG: STAS domain-containing protein [Quadrisphaera sp.]